MAAACPIVDCLSSKKRHEFLNWAAILAHEYVVHAYFAMGEYRGRPTKKRFIAICVLFLDPESEFDINLRSEKSDPSNRITKQVHADLVEHLTTARANLKHANKLRKKGPLGITGRIQASMSDHSRPAPPPAVFEPFLSYITANNSVANLYASWSAVKKQKDYTINKADYEYGQQVCRSMIDRLKEANFDFLG